jgi:hypothetical protein
MVWASSNGKGNAFDTFFTAGRDAVVNTWSIQEEERMNLSQSKKQKKNENGEGKRTTHFSKHYFLLLTYPFEFCA